MKKAILSSIQKCSKTSLHKSESMHTTKRSLIPRKIWILWYQGLSEAPFIVRKCVDSWIRENPTWDIVILDSDCLSQYIRLDLPEKKVTSLCLAHQSDLVRLALLSKYGGVWADATTFCMKPLNNWIDDCTTSGFFAFYKPSRYRILSNWFIASEKNSPIVSKLYKNLTLFWMKNDIKEQTNLQRKVTRRLFKILNRNEKTAKYWLTPIVIKLLREYPYYVFHFLFERLISTDPESQTIWKNTKKLSAKDPQAIKRNGLLSLATESTKKQIDDKQVPMYKLTWKYDRTKYSSSSLLFYLIQGRE